MQTGPPNRSLDPGNTIKRLVVEDDQFARLAALHIQFKAWYALAVGQRKGCHTVFRRAGREASMGPKKRARKIRQERHERHGSTDPLSRR